MALEYIIDYLLENRLLVSTLGKLYMQIINKARYYNLSIHGSE